MAYATVADLAARWRPLSIAERDRATVLLADASVYVDTECPPADPLTDADARKIVVVNMVKRAMLTPVDQVPVTSQQETTGPFSQSLSFANPTGDMYMSKSDRKLLGCGRQAAFSIDLAPDAGIAGPGSPLDWS